MSEEIDVTNISVAHHTRKDLCATRCLYRQGKKLTSVQVYTVAKESRHLLIYDVPILCPLDDLRGLLIKYGKVLNFDEVTDYLKELRPLQEFTKVVHVHYQKLQNARFAKKKVDDLNYFGGILHVCYAPELEALQETHDKLVQRRKDLITWKKRFSNEVCGEECKNLNVNENNSDTFLTGDFEFQPSMKLIKAVNSTIWWENNYKKGISTRPISEDTYKKSNEYPIKRKKGWTSQDSYEFKKRRK